MSCMLDEIVDTLVGIVMGARALMTRRRGNGGRAVGCRRGGLHRGKGDSGGMAGVERLGYGASAMVDVVEPGRRALISTPESSLEYLGIHRNTETTPPLLRPEEAVLMAPGGLLGVSKRAAG